MWRRLTRLRVFFIRIICCILPGQATQNYTTFILIFVILYLLQGHHGKDHRVISISTRPKTHLASNTQIWTTSQFKYATILGAEKSVSWVQLLHYTSLALSHGAPQIIWCGFWGQSRSSGHTGVTVAVWARTIFLSSQTCTCTTVFFHRTCTIAKKNYHSSARHFFPLVVS